MPVPFAVFWWTGRGFLALLTLIGVFGLFGVLISLVVGDQVFDSQPWLWGVGWILAAVVNWIVGSRINRRPILAKPGTWKNRLTYRPRNRFMGVPLELWSLPAWVLGVFLVIRGL